MSTQALYEPWIVDGDVPAPWFVEDTDERVVVQDAQGGLVADCTNGFDGDDGWVMSSACGPLANLIAAAPAMLAALREIVAINDESQGEFRKRGGTRRGLSIVAAREAIAKATPLDGKKD